MDRTFTPLSLLVRGFELEKTSLGMLNAVKILVMTIAKKTHILRKAIDGQGKWRMEHQILLILDQIR